MELSVVAERLNQFAMASANRAQHAANPAAAASLRQAEEQFRQLANAVGAAVDELLAQRAAVKNAIRKPRAAAGMDAMAFWGAYGTAIEACRAQYGELWKVAAPIGETVLVTIPAKFRSHKTERGTTIKWQRDHRMPGARFWPDGRLPADLLVIDDYARHEAGSEPVEHDAKWHRDHGYVFDRKSGEWVSEIQYRAQAAYEDAIEYRRTQNRISLPVRRMVSMELSGRYNMAWRQIALACEATTGEST